MLKLYIRFKPARWEKKVDKLAVKKKTEREKNRMQPWDWFLDLLRNMVIDKNSAVGLEC